MSDTIDTTEQIIEDDPIAVRRAKREALMAAGKDPYGHAFAYSHHLADLAEQYADLEDGASTEDEVKVAGRVMAKRDQGKLAFLELRDSTGDMQLFCRINALGEDAFAELKDLDVGDWIGVEGTMMRTKRGQLSVSVASFELLSKSLRPLPEKFHGLADKETRYRQRYVDLVMNREVRDTFEKRFKVVSAIRRYMEDHATTRWRRPSCTLSSAARTRVPSSRTTTRWTRTSTCASPPSCISSACWWAASRRSSRSGASSATRAWIRIITPSSPPWSSTRRSVTSKA